MSERKRGNSNSDRQITMRVSPKARVKWKGIEQSAGDTLYKVLGLRKCSIYIL